MVSKKYRLTNAVVFLFTLILFLFLFLFAPQPAVRFSLSYLFFGAVLFFLATYLTFFVCHRVQEGFVSDFTATFLSPKRNLAPLFLILLFSSLLVCGSYSLFFNSSFSNHAILLFVGYVAYLPFYCLSLLMAIDRKEYLFSLIEDIESEIKDGASQKSLPSLQKMKSIALNHLAKKDYETFGFCMTLLFSLTEKRKGKSLITLYRCLKEIALECLNDTRACTILLGALRSNFQSVFGKGLLPQARITCEFTAFIAVKAEEESNIASSSSAISFLGEIQSCLISAKHSSSAKSIVVLEFLGEKALKKGYPSLLSEVLKALGAVSMQCIESENMALLEKADNVVSHIASLSLMKGRGDITLHILSHISRLNNESYKNPKFFSITWNLADCLGEIGMSAAKIHEETVVGTVASLLRKMGIKSIMGYIRGEKEDITPARYAIRKLKALKRELEKENMNTAATEVEKAIWDIADAARL